MSEKRQLIIKTEWCKGCGICVEFCPKKVLSLVDGKVIIENINDCISCGLCELRCPDNAIYLGGTKNE